MVTLDAQCTIKNTASVILILAIVSVPFVVRPYKVLGNSMEPTLHNGDIVLAERVSLGFFKARRGELLVFKNPHKKMEEEINVKRVIGLPGETVHVRLEDVVITRSCEGGGGGAAKPRHAKVQAQDGKCQTTYGSESTIGRGVNGIEFEMFLGAEDYFVLGDNRRNSSDSRLFGAVQKEDMIGRYLFKIWPLFTF